MKRHFLRIPTFVVVVLTFASAAWAVTRTVSHPGNGGDYASVVAALAAASPGDTIEIIDNSAPFIGNVHVALDNITLQGQASLDPPPVLRGQAAAHPLAGSLAAPQKWFWTSGDPNSAETMFDASGAAVINAAAGLTLRNLRIEADPDGPSSAGDCAGTLDFRFGTNGTVENCVLVATDKERATFTANAHLFDGVVFSGGVVPFEHHGGSGVLRIENSLVDAGYHTLYIYGGEALVTDTVIQENRPTGAAQGAHVGNLYGPAKATFVRCTFRKATGEVAGNSFCQIRIENRGTAFGGDDYNTGRWSPDPIEAVFDQCDFVGSATAPHSSVVALSNGRASWVVKTLRFTGCNFYNLLGNPFNVRDFLYPGNEYFAGGVRDLFEDGNVFKMATNNAVLTGIRSGGNSLALDQGEPLYVDAAGGDYRLATNSPAATLATGAHGVSEVARPVTSVTVAHPGHTPAGEYTTLADALANANDATCITIIDNSAPFVVDVDLATSNGITIQGLDTLDPRPTLKATGTNPFGIKLSGAARNITLRNLILDGTAVDGVDSSVLELADGGPATIENCRIVGGPTTDVVVRSRSNERLLRDCEIVATAPGGTGVSQRIGGGFLLENSRIESAGVAFSLGGGLCLLTGCSLRGDGPAVIDIPAPDTTCYLRLDFSIVTSTATGAPGTANDLIHVNNSVRRRFVLIDNSDLIGSQAAVGAGASPTARAIVLAARAGSDPYYPVTKMSVTNSIFYNLAAGAYALNGNLATVTIPGMVFDITQGFEDYCAYQIAPNTAAAQGSVKGANSLDLHPTDWLYANAIVGDFRVRPTSPAATLNSTGTPPYAGSQGIGEGPATVQAETWALYR